MTDSPDMDLLGTAADNPNQIRIPAAKDDRGVLAVTFPLDRGETVCSPNVYGLMVAATEAEAKSYLQQVRRRVSDDQLQIKIVTSFSRPPAAIIENAKRLNVDLIIMSGRGQSSMRRRSYGSVIGKVLCGAICPTLVIREQKPIHEDDRVRVKEV